MKGNVQTVLSGIAICVSLVAVLYSADVAKRISSSDHHAAEQVKSNTARLFSSLMSIAEKAALESLEEGYQYDILREQESLMDFVNSESAAAYRAWIEEDGKWKNFFLDLAILSGATHLSEVSYGTIAELLSLLESLDSEDIEEVVRYNSNLIDMISSGLVKNSLVVKGIVATHDPIEDDEAVKLLIWLKRNGVVDPDVDMYLGVLTNDVRLLKQALTEGADRSASLERVIGQYRDKLQEAGVAFADSSEHEPPVR